MIMAHLAQQRQNVRSTKPKQPTSLQIVCPPPPDATPSNQVFVMTQPLSKLFTDDTGRFPVRARSGNQYVMIAFHADGNLILQQAFKSKSNRHRIAAYNAIMTRLAARGLSVDLQILDNEASSAYKEAITFKWNATLSLFPLACIAAIGQSGPFAPSRTTSWKSWPASMQRFHLIFGISCSHRQNSLSISFVKPRLTLESVHGSSFRGRLISTRHY